MGSSHSTPIGSGDSVEESSRAPERMPVHSQVLIIGFEVDLFWMDQELTAKVTIFQGSLLEAEVDELAFYSKDKVGKCLVASMWTLARRSRTQVADFGRHKSIVGTAIASRLASRKSEGQFSSGIA